VLKRINIKDIPNQHNFQFRKDKLAGFNAFFMCVMLLLLMSSPSGLFAAVTGVCSNCHNMHNSQDGTLESKGGSREFLLNTQTGTDCWGCHAVGTGNNIDPLTGAPQIRHTNISDLAGGNFAYVTGDKAGVNGNSVTRGHNVIDTGVIDNNFSAGTYPPGDEFFQSGEGLTNNRFTCAGKFGCHGDRTASDELSAIAGAHHESDSVLKFGSIDESSQGSSVGTSYRFLSGVKGGEDSDWQATESKNDHNEYKGADGGTESTAISPGGSTMSGFCAECHGNFHGDASDVGGGGSPWKRHPADVSLPGAGTEYDQYTSYNLQVPVARTVIQNSPGSEVNPGGTSDDIVMCLSCHRAHASPYKDILRWDYSSMIAGTNGNSAGTGCFVCHSSKDSK
jgi:hypothetical protein